MAMGFRLWFDALSALLLFVVALFGAWLPRWLAHRSDASPSSSPDSTSSRLYHLGNCLSGGVMLSAGFCHLLADALPTLGSVGKSEFPMATFLAALGLLLTLAADQVVHAVTEAAAAERAAAASDEKDGMELAHHAPSDKAGTQRPEKRAESAGGGGSAHGKLEVPGSERRTPHRNGSSAGHTKQQPSSEFSPLLRNGVQPHAQNGHHQAVGSCDEEEGKGEGYHYHAHSAAHECSDGAHMDVLLGDGAKQLSFATTVLLASALCVHSVLEGMALGAQQTMKATENIMIAIAAHKGLAAYALGASVVESKASAKRFWSVILTFSLASPVGIFIGYALSSVSDSKGGAALSALASGTFLYVAMMEVIPRELGHSQMRILKMLAICIGFGLMSLLAIWA